MFKHLLLPTDGSALSKTAVQQGVALAKSLGIVDATVDGLRSDIKKNLEREVKFRLLARNKNAVMDALVANAELDLPSASVQAELNRLAEGARAERRWKKKKTWR